MSGYSDLYFTVFMILFGMVFLIGGSAFAYVAYESYVETQNETDNPSQTTGTIINNNIDTDTSSSTTRRPNSRTKDPKYRFSAEYRYQVNDEQYISESIQPANDVLLLNSLSSAEEYKNEYRVGSEVTVKYDPNDPSESYLQSGGGGLLIPSMISLTLILVGSVITRAGVLATIDVIKNPEGS